MLLANHPSLLDVVFLLAHIKALNCVAKGSLKKNIFLYPAIKASGYILNNDEERLMNLSFEALKRGENLLIFPEGTRTKNHQIILHKAASYIAIHSAKSLLPIGIIMRPKSFQKNLAWYAIPKPICYTFKAGEMINLADFEKDKQNPLRVRALHSRLNQFYQKEIQ